ncbi:MAG: hypothetical protein NTV21_14530 [Planctomycetota bacterium]|nr:hypothetical protein [Planctomycetota bacterium]
MLTWIRRTLGAVLFAVAMLALAGGLDAKSEQQPPQVVGVVRWSCRGQPSSIVKLPPAEPAPPALPVTERLPWGWLVFCTVVGVFAFSRAGKRDAVDSIAPVRRGAGY